MDCGEYTTLAGFDVDCGENTVVVVHVVLDIDPSDPANMPSLFAFEC